MKALTQNKIEHNRQRQMLRLMERYSKLIQLPNSWVLPYSWIVSYIDTADPAAEICTTDFFAHTNNIAFAAMIFEGQMLPKKIAIVDLKFNSPVL